MAKKTTLDLENLSALGVEGLARLVIGASARDAGFKKVRGGRLGERQWTRGHRGAYRPTSGRP